MPLNDLQSLIAQLNPTIDAKPAIIALARLGPAAVEATPRLIQICAETTDPGVRAICLDAFMKVLVEDDDPRATEVSQALAGMFDEPRCRRVRRRIALTLAYIGRAAHPALPALVRRYNCGARNSVRNAARCARYCITHELLKRGSESEHRIAIQALSQLRNYGSAWLLYDFLSSTRGSPAIRAEAKAAYTRPDQNHRIAP